MYSVWIVNIGLLLVLNTLVVYVRLLPLALGLLGKACPVGIVILYDDTKLGSTEFTILWPKKLIYINAKKEMVKDKYFSGIFSWIMSI